MGSRQSDGEPPSRGEERLDIQAHEGLGYPAFRVRNPLHATRYDVFAPAYPEEGPWLCECPDFAHRGAGRCKHVDAVRAWLTEHPLPPSEPVRDGRGEAAAARLTRLLHATVAGSSPGSRLRWAESVLEGELESRRPAGSRI